MAVRSASCDAIRAIEAVDLEGAADAVAGEILQHPQRDELIASPARQASRGVNRQRRFAGLDAHVAFEERAVAAGDAERPQQQPVVERLGKLNAQRLARPGRRHGEPPMSSRRADARQARRR